jgi:hypothetical protein
MARYAMVQDASGIVVNVIEWSGDTADWQPDPGYTMVPDEPAVCGPGWSWDGTTFTPPPGGLPGTGAMQQQPAQQSQARARGAWRPTYARHIPPDRFTP